MSLQQLAQFIVAPDAAQTEAFTDYTGLLPFECRDLYDFIVARFMRQVPVAPPGGGAPVRPKLTAADWWPSLEGWKQTRLQRFNQMLMDFNARFVTTQLATVRASTAARALELQLPIDRASLCLLYDRRLVFQHRGADQVLRLEALSPLVRTQLQAHYSAAHADTRSIDRAISAVLLDTVSNVLTNDVKGRLVSGYIMHRIRQLVQQRAPSVTMSLMHGGAPWRAGRSRDSIQLKFAEADVVDFPGSALPPAGLLGDLTRPKFFLPLRSNYPHFDLFYFSPGKRGGLLGMGAKPSRVVRLSITVKLRGHAFDLTRLDVAQWQGLLNGPLAAATVVPLISEAPYVWVGLHTQNAGMAARNRTFLLDLDEMVTRGFPMLAHLRLRAPVALP